MSRAKDNTAPADGGGRAESAQVERFLREALDVITGGSTAAYAVSTHYRYLDPPPPYD